MATWAQIQTKSRSEQPLLCGGLSHNFSLQRSPCASRLPASVFLHCLPALFLPSELAFVKKVLESTNKALPIQSELHNFDQLEWLCSNQ